MKSCTEKSCTGRSRGYGPTYKVCIHRKFPWLACLRFDWHHIQRNVGHIAVPSSRYPSVEFQLSKIWVGASKASHFCFRRICAINQMRIPRILGAPHSLGAAKRRALAEQEEGKGGADSMMPAWMRSSTPGELFPICVCISAMFLSMAEAFTLLPAQSSFSMPSRQLHRAGRSHVLCSLQLRGEARQMPAWTLFTARKGETFSGHASKSLCGTFAPQFEKATSCANVAQGKGSDSILEGMEVFDVNFDGSGQRKVRPVAGSSCHSAVCLTQGTCSPCIERTRNPSNLNPEL